MIERSINKIDCEIANITDLNQTNNLLQRRHEWILRQDEMYVNEAKGAQIGARSQWLEEGEKSMKYFLNLEKKHQTYNGINVIRTNYGKTLYKSQIANFYKTLYKEKSVSEGDIDKLLLNNR